MQTRGQRSYVNLTTPKNSRQPVSEWPGCQNPLANRWPHDSVLERDIRSIQAVTRAVRLQARFASNLKHGVSGREASRYVPAAGEEFPWTPPVARPAILLQDRSQTPEKFEPSAAASLFCGYRLDSGPESFMSRADYKKVKTGAAGAEIAIPVPFEELFVPEGEEEAFCFRTCCRGICRA